ncbi:enoyl-CoA hydratase-related protein [Leisingera sp. D0M16]|uniref:enoyl-CoA hydratase-related protein n=1 Tax=Leisingera coralii TaxID=3351347 RepID=UPI003B7A906F
MTGLVLYEVRGSTAILTLNRPEQRNSVDAAMTEALRNAMARFAADPAARVGIITGAGPVFCAGMDLKAFLDGQGNDILFGTNRFAGFVDAPRSKPVIAAVNGPALAGGFEIALACDLIVAAESAVFGLPEVGVGIFACAGGPFRFARKIAPAKALELALTAERIPADEALALGLVSSVVEAGALLDTALALAERIARNAPLGVAATLTLARAAEALGERELWGLSDALWASVSTSSDAIEGPRAFTEKRAPAWTGAKQVMLTARMPPPDGIVTEPENPASGGSRPGSRAIQGIPE